MGVFFSIDVGINLVVTQELKMLIGRDIAIRINPGALYLPVPNITIHIGREKFRSEDSHEPCGKRHAENDGKRPPVCSPENDEKNAHAV